MSKILQVCAIDLSVDALLKPLIKALMDQGHIVHNACSNTGKFNSLIEQGLNMVEIPIERRISFLSNLKSLVALYKLMKSESYDIVHVHTPIAAVLGRIAAKLAGVKKIVYTAHGFYFHDGMSRSKYRFFYWLEKIIALYFTDWIFLQSKEDFELCIDSKFKDQEHIVHISNGVDIVKKFNPIIIESSLIISFKSELGIKEDEVVFTFVGRFVREKGVFELLEAFHRLVKVNQNVKLLMIGDTLSTDRDQKTSGELLEITDHPNINVLGMRTDIPQLLAITDVFVLPSYREGLPRSIIEAMAMAKPIIATNIRGCREEVVHNENGFLVEKGDREQLYKEMLDLARDRNKRELFGRKSRELVEDLFDEEKVIQKQLEVLNGLV